MAPPIDPVKVTVATSGMWRGQVAIVSSGTVMATTLLQLIQQAGYNGPDQPLQLQIAAKLIDGSTDRPAMTLALPRPGQQITGTDASTHGWPIAAGVEYLLATALCPMLSFPRSLGAGFNAQIQVIW